MVAVSTGRPKDKVITDENSRLTLDWDAYFSRLESRLGFLEESILGSGVTSFEGRTGVVISASGDYTASEVTNVAAGNIAATDVQAAINELDSEKQPIDSDLTALAALASTGFVVRTAAATYDLRSLTAPSEGLTITNPAGIAGNAIFALANDLSALEALGSTGIACRTAADTWAQRTLTAPAAGLSISNPAGVAGNPTFALANDLSALEGLGSTGIAVRSAADTWVQRSVAAGTGIGVSNGDGVSGNPTVSLSHLGIQNLTDPNADRILFWDDSAGAVDWLTAGSGLSISGTTISTTGGSGLILQVLATDYTTNANLTTVIPYDDTTPTSTEGTQILSQAITLASTSSRVLISVSCWGSTPNSGDIWAAATFRSTTCINCQATMCADGINGPEVIAYTFIDSPATSGSVTYSVRVGPDASVNLRMNGSSSARLYGGTAKCTLTLTELAS